MYFICYYIGQENIHISLFKTIEGHDVVQMLVFQVVESKFDSSLECDLVNFRTQKINLVGYTDKCRSSRLN